MCCLTPEQIELFAQQKLPPSETEVLGQHVAACDSCRSKVEQCRANEKILGRLLQSPNLLEIVQPQAAISPSPDILDAHGTGGSISTEPPKDSFAGYDLVREIHRGGQGVVYQAIQKSTKRKVAIKVMREGPFAGPRDRARFQREVEILGQLKHPSIVAIHESGVASGNYYFVMDYISGQPLDVWMAAKQRTTANTLELFTKICEAINAAHLKGVIHRDLKPGNIRIDCNGEPHVLDFGLAKVGGGTDATAVTVTGQFIGSLPWASPEQAEGTPDKIDTRTDVYSLGVILYQMLTGKFPYEVVGNIRDVLDRIMRTEPTRPSTISRQINNEVETIVLKCLSKERERRYQTAGELARDIRHYLAGEPVEAKRDSSLYILKKTLRRYRALVGVACGLIITITAALLISLAFWRLAERRLVAEMNARTAEQEQRLAAEKAKQQAEHERANAEDRERLAQLHLYTAHMSAAQEAWRSGNIRRTLALLSLHRPGPHEPDLRSFDWYYLWRLCHQEKMTLWGHTGQVWGLAFSPDGRILATGSEDTTIRLWDMATGQQKAVMRGHTARVNRVAFSQDGKLLASGAWDNTARLWDTETATERLVLAGHNKQVTAVVLANDGEALLTASADGAARLWRFASPGEPQTLIDPVGYAEGTGFSPDHTVFVRGNDAGNITLFDLATGRVLSTFDQSPCSLWTAVFTDDGKFLATSGGGLCRVTKIWDLPAQREKATLPSAASLAFSPDGKTLAMGRFDDTSVRLVDLATLRDQKILAGHTYTVSALLFSRDQRTLVSGGMDNMVKIWDLTRPPEPRMLDLNGRDFGDAVFSQDVSICAVARKAGATAVYDLALGKELHQFSGRDVHGSAVSLSPDGKILATAGTSRAVNLWDWRTGKLLFAVTGEVDGPAGLVFSPDGCTLAVGGPDHSPTLWHLQTHKLHIAAQDPAIRGTPVAFSPDGLMLVVASGNSITLLDTQTGERRRELSAGQPLNAVAFSRNGTWLAAAAGRHTNFPGYVYVWDTLSGRQIAGLEGQRGAAESVQFCPDGRSLASVSAHETILWDLQTWQARLTLSGGADEVGVGGSAFSDDGKRFSAVYSSGMVIVWNAAADEEVEMHPETARVLQEMASKLIKKGAPEEAEPLLRRALAITQRAVGLEAPLTVSMLIDLRACLRAQGGPSGLSESGECSSFVASQPATEY